MNSLCSPTSANASKVSEGDTFGIPTTAVDQVLGQLNGRERPPCDPT
ncbi:hypothetical protein [Rhodococcus sp. T2V]|nr:hypothetical protein [Rhodococcus sp. T2V]